MIPIYPLSEENIMKHRGRMVLACMHDGRTYVGRLTHCRNGEIILNGEENTALHAANLKAKPRNARTPRKNRKTPPRKPRFAPYSRHTATGTRLTVTGITVSEPEQSLSASACLRFCSSFKTENAPCRYLSGPFRLRRYRHGCICFIPPIRFYRRIWPLGCGRRPPASPKCSSRGI